MGEREGVVHERVVCGMVSVGMMREGVVQEMCVCVWEREEEWCMKEWCEDDWREGVLQEMIRVQMMRSGVGVVGGRERRSGA